MAHPFITSEDGAVTVDWVVLTFGVTITGIAMMGTIGPALGEMAVKVVAALEETIGSINEDGGEISFRANFDFAGDTSGWSGAETAFIDGFGDVLGPIGGSGGLESVSNTFEIGPGSTSATFTFDLLAFDSLDDEDAVLYIDGREIGRVTSGPGGLTFTDGELEGITFNAEVLANEENLGGLSANSHGNWGDSISRISITVANPNENVSFGIGSTANQSVGDESWGIDNFVVEATAPTGTTAPTAGAGGQGGQSNGQGNQG